MQQYDITVPANATFRVSAAGRYIKYLSGTNGGGDVSLSITPGLQGGNKITLVPGQAYRMADDQPIPDSWTLANKAGGATILGQVIVGNGRLDDSTVQGVVQVVDGGKARSLNGSAFCGAVVQAGVAAQYGQLQLWNPVANPNRLVVEQIVFAGGSGTAMSGFLMASNTALTFVQNGQAKKVPGTPSVAELRATTSGVAPAVPYNLQMPITGPGDKFIFAPHEPYVIAPGYGLLVWANVVNQSAIAAFEWYEEPNV